VPILNEGGEDISAPTPLPWCWYGGRRHSRHACRGLHGEDALVALLGCAVDFFEDQLAHLHPLFEADMKRTAIPDFQADSGAWIVGILRGAETRVERGRRDVNAHPKPGQAAASFDSACQPRGVGQANLLLRPSKNKSSRLQDESLSGEDQRRGVL